MAKLFMHNTHGVTIIEGTIIHCYAAYAEAYAGNSSPIAVYLYNDAGKLERINFLEGVADTLYERFEERELKERPAGVVPL